MPKVGVKVLTVRGEFRNQVGVIVDKSSSSSTAKVRLVNDDDIVDLPFDDISEYVGDDL